MAQMMDTVGNCQEIAILVAAYFVNAANYLADRKFGADRFRDRAAVVGQPVRTVVEL